MSSRLLGTMITYGYQRLAVESELDLAQTIGAQVLEILPDWRSYPDPLPLKRRVKDRGLSIHSAHGCWGSQSIRAGRVDLGETNSAAHQESVDDLKRCIDWLEAAGGTYLVVHPGGLSLADQLDARRECLAGGLIKLANHAEGSQIVVCVENMPPGVFPGSRMSDLHALLREINMPRLALALDVGHAHLSALVSSETQAAGTLLSTTHVHDNHGRKDTHDAPGNGSIDWEAWAKDLDSIDYGGPIVLECIRQLRDDINAYRAEVLAPLLTGSSRAGNARGTGCSE